MKIKILLLLIVASILSCQKNDKKTGLTHSLQNKLDSLITEIKVPGANLSVILPSGDSISISSGLSDVEKQQPMKPSLLMPSGSIGKTYVTAIAFKLIENNQIKLTDKVVDILKDDWLQKIPNINDLTIDMILSHTSGLPRYEYIDQLWLDIKKNPLISQTIYDRLKYVFGAKPLHEPGKGWGYSDTNFILLGAIIEKITGKAYYDNFRQMLSEIQILKHTIPSDKPNIRNLASGYTGFLTNYGFPEKVTENQTMIMNPQMEWCGGGVASTTTDLARWAKLLYEGKVVSEQSVYKIVTPCNQQTDLLDSAKYGYGTFIWDDSKFTLYGHTGFFPGYKSIVQYSPKYKFSIAMQINRDNPNSQKSLNVLLEPIRNEIVSYLEQTSSN